MKENGTLQVLYDGKVVGNLALMAGRKIAFEYSEEWMETGFSISPFSLPLKEQVFIPTKEYFGGLFGVFGDSLPDGWGNLLLNRMLRKKGMKPEKMTMLNRLAIVGQSGMGALAYRTEEHFSFEPQGYDLDDLALQCQKILNTEYSEKLDELYLLGGTSGGARPKIMTEIDGEDWIIKFPAHVDGQDAGGMEYEYALCAKACGIDMTEVRLFPSKKCKGYFGIKRFDRERIVDGIGTKVKAGNKKKIGGSKGKQAFISLFSVLSSLFLSPYLGIFIISSCLFSYISDIIRTFAAEKKEKQDGQIHNTFT